MFGGQPDAAEEKGPAEALALLEQETCTLGADGIDKLRELLERELQAQVRSKLRIVTLNLSRRRAPGR